MFGAELITGVSCIGLPSTAETGVLEVPASLLKVMDFLQNTDTALNFTLRTALCFTDHSQAVVLSLASQLVHSQSLTDGLYLHYMGLCLNQKVVSHLQKETSHMLLLSNKLLISSNN